MLRLRANPNFIYERDRSVLYAAVTQQQEKETINGSNGQVVITRAGWTSSSGMGRVRCMWH